MQDTDHAGDAAERFLRDISGPYTEVVLQPTTLCNVNCTYCYIPGRDRQRLMPVTVVQAVAKGIATQGAPFTVDVLWHAGEPLATPRSYFQELLEAFEPLRQGGAIRHRMRTNATLIDDRWCELLMHYDIAIGVSIDGPASHTNANRVDWQGAGIFDRVMRGITRLKDHEIPFTALAVVSSETIARARELLAFIDELGPTSLAINIEELENANTARPQATREEVEAFWGEVLAYLRDGSKLRIRELTALGSFLSLRRNDHPTTRRRVAEPTILHDGNVVVLSPELAGANAAHYNNFIVGNVLRTPLQEIIASLDQVVYVREFAEGLANCQASCSLWDFCQGADAGNRYFEHGRFNLTETRYCHSRRQAPVIAMLALTESQPTADPAHEIASILGELAAHAG